MKCLECSGKIQRLCGIICANFWTNRIGLGTCNTMWHGQCYEQGVKDNLYVLVAWKFNNSIIDDNFLEDNNVIRFKNTRNGGHTMISFQCDICHFWSLKGCWTPIGIISCCCVCVELIGTVCGQGKDPQLIWTDYRASGLLITRSCWAYGVTCGLVMRSLDKRN